MIKITLRSILDISEALGSRTQVIDLDEPETVEVFLNKLMINKHSVRHLIYDSDCNCFRSDITFMINGKSINLEKGLQTTLNDMDDFFILPRLGGG